MFARLAQNEPHLREWLSGQLTTVYDQLVSNVNETQVRQAQGRAQLLREMLKLLDSAARAART